MTKADILTLENVHKQFKDFSLENIAFRLEPGYIMGLVGPNGSGKTTTIKLIMNMLSKSSGTITVNGFDSVQDEVKAKESIGYVCDDSMFVDEWKTGDVKRALSLYYKSFDPKKYDRYMSDFELPPKRKIKDYSRGMKTKLMIAAALSRETKLLLLDEPTSGLDPAVRAELLDILQEYIVGGERSVLFSTHITTDLEKIADYITLINKGKMVFSADRDTVLNDYRVIKGSIERLDGIKSLLIGMRKSGTGFEGLVKEQNSHSLPVECISEQATLDDIVIYHTLGGRHQ